MELQSRVEFATLPSFTVLPTENKPTNKPRSLVCSLNLGSKSNGKAVTPLGDIERYQSMSVNIVIRFTDEQAAALKAERTRSGVPTNEYVRRAVACALDPLPCDFCLVHPINELQPEL